MWQAARRLLDKGWPRRHAVHHSAPFARPPSDWPSGAIEGFLDHPGQASVQPLGWAGLGGAVHDGQRFRFQVGERAQDPFGLSRVRHVAREGALLHLLHRPPGRSVVLGLSCLAACFSLLWGLFWYVTVVLDHDGRGSLAFRHFAPRFGGVFLLLAIVGGVFYCQQWRRSDLLGLILSSVSFLSILG